VHGTNEEKAVKNHKERERERVQEGLMITIDEQKAVLPLGIMIRLRGVLKGIWRTNAWVRGYMNA